MIRSLLYSVKGNEMKKTALFCLLTILLSILLNSCSGDAGPARYDNVKLSEKAITLRVGDSFAINADTVYANGDGELFWQSSNDGIATVVDGVAVGVSPGVCTVRAYTANGGADMCTVTVNSADTASGNPINPDSGESLDLEALVNFEVLGCPGSYAYTDKNNGIVFSEINLLSYEVRRSYYPESETSPAFIYMTVVFKCVKTYDVDGEQGTRKTGFFASVYKEDDVFCESAKVAKYAVRVGEEFELFYPFKVGTDGVTVRDFYMVLGDTGI